MSFKRMIYMLVNLTVSSENYWTTHIVMLKLLQ